MLAGPFQCTVAEEEPGIAVTPVGAADTGAAVDAGAVADALAVPKIGWCDVVVTVFGILPVNT